MTASLAPRRGVESRRALAPSFLRTLAAYDEPPVVARMIIEIRSDGTRTVARGALEDIVSGERVKIEAAGGSPMQLAASLASNLLSTPFMIGRATSALMRNRLGRGKRE